MRLVDAHCHLEAEDFRGRLDEIIAGARAAGLVKLVSSTIVPGEWELARATAARFPEAAFAWGVHPWYAETQHLGQLDRLRDARAAGAAAIGEIGLDAKIASPPMSFQEEIFEAQLRVARDLELPVVLHCRGAFNELLRILNRVGAPAPGGIVHAFSGSAEIAEALMQHRIRFSMGGALTYKPSRKRREVLAVAYPEHLLLETDSPDIPPVQAPERPNVPANIRYNLHGAAELLGLPEAEVAEQTTRNAARVFGWPLDSLAHAEIC